MSYWTDDSDITNATTQRLARENLRLHEKLARAMKVVEAVEATMCIEFPEQLRNAMQRWWDEEAGR